MKKTTLLLSAIIVGLIGCTSVNKQKEGSKMSDQLISRDVLFGNPEKTGVKLSANGEYISYLASLNGVLNIFTAKIDTPNQSTPITKDTGRGIRQYFWLYDNKHIAYLKDDGGDENWRLHVVNIASKEDKAYTPPKVTARIAQVSDKFPEEILIALNDRDESYHDIYRLNIATGHKTLIFKNDEKFSDFIFDDDYVLRFASKTTPEGGNQYFKVKDTVHGNYTWEFYIETGLEDVYTTNLLGLTSDGKILYMLDSRGRDLNVLKEIDVATKSEKILAEAQKAEIQGIKTQPKTGIIQAYSINYLREEWTCFDEDFQAHYNTIKDSLEGEANITSRTLDDRLWVVAEMKDDGPISYYLYQKEKKSLTFLFYHREALTKYNLTKMEGVVITARDGLELPCYVTKPVNTSGPVPLVLLVHGGPWARDDWGFDAEAQWLANRGYAVLQVNFRSSTGFGKSFISKGNLEWGAKMHEDLLDAVNWAINEGIADPKKIAIYGGSYGGYASLWAATQSGDVFKCAVDIVGPSNLQTLLSTFPAYWASFMEIAYKQIGDARTAEGKALLKERSPLTHVDKIKIPVLIAQGEKDPRVKQAESEQIVAAMKAKGLGYMYMLFKDEGHGFARPENKFTFYGIAERFLADNLGGKHQPLSAEEISKSTLAAEHKALLEKNLKSNAKV